MANIAISGSNKDVAVIAVREVSAKIERRIIRIVEYQEPLVAFRRKPLKSVFL
jgi:hypothetical protein